MRELRPGRRDLRRRPRGIRQLRPQPLGKQPAEPAAENGPFPAAASGPAPALVGLRAIEASGEADTFRAIAAISTSIAPVPPPFLTVQEVADLARCHEQTVRAAIHRGELEARRGGRARLIIHADAARRWATARDGEPRPSLAEEAYLRLIAAAPDAMVVYAVQAGRNGPVKIGRVNQVRKLLRRLNQLQTGSAEPLYLRRVIATWPGGGEEQRLHARFGEDRLEGEWFAPSPHVLAFLEWASP